MTVSAILHNRCILYYCIPECKDHFAQEMTFHHRVRHGAMFYIIFQIINFIT